VFNLHFLPEVVMRTALLVLLSLGLFTTVQPSLTAAEPEAKELASKAREVLSVHCYRCHGQDGAVEGGFNFILDARSLVARNKVVPGNAAKSKLFRRIHDGEMPPEEEKTRPSEAEVALLKKWIEAGAPDFSAPAPPRTFVTTAAVVEAIRNDLQAAADRDRPFIRYFTITHLYNAGLSNDELRTYVAGLSKLVNSLSWGREVVKPRPIDKAETILRVDLRDYKWTEATWDRILALYPYGLRPDLAATRECIAMTNSPLCYVRGDWFVATASRPPLYHEVLQLPLSDRDLERELRVDVQANIRGERLLRAGFNGSGVSRNNRLIERHETAFGAYWKSYDFGSNTGRKNLFASPLGPGGGGFVHDGGEIIFHLPNGLQAYLLADATGKRIDKGPTEIVSDPKRPDRAVVNGLSCMSCHARGLIDKNDQIRGHVEKNANAFPKVEADTILTLYAPREKFTAVFTEDVERFRKAVEKTGAKLGATEPVAALALKFEAEVGLDLAASEFGLTPSEFNKALDQHADLARVLGALRANGGTVQRQVVVDIFPQGAQDLRLGEVLIRKTTVASKRPGDWTPPVRFPGNWTPPRTPVVKWENETVVNLDVGKAVKWDNEKLARLNPPPHRAWPELDKGYTNHLAISPDGKTAVTTSQDNNIRVWDVATGRNTRVIEPASAQTRCLAISPDGKIVAGGFHEKNVRFWILATGKEILTLAGHRGPVNSIAFSPDGKLAASSANDGTVRIWDTTNAAEVHSFADLKFPMSAVFSPDGKLLAAGTSEGVLLWDVANRRLVWNLLGHTKGVKSVAFSPDSAMLASTADDRTTRLWDVAAQRNTAILPGHNNQGGVVTFSPDGSMLATVGGDQTIRLFDLASRSMLGIIKLQNSGSGSVAFTPDGKSLGAALFGPSTVVFWDLPRR
jgi:WD40 repeat protein/mono/diheme cytochrome c family protein